MRNTFGNYFPSQRVYFSFHEFYLESLLDKYSRVKDLNMTLGLNSQSSVGNTQFYNVRASAKWCPENIGIGAMLDLGWR